MLILSHLSKIVELISKNAVVSVVAGTGSGKSVGLPAAIAATGSRCFVVVPTRTAAHSLSEYQKVLQVQNKVEKSYVDTLIGFGAEGKITYGPETKIAYVTGGHMRRKLLGYFNGGKAEPIDFCDVLVADEVHSGSLDTTMIISMWMAAAKLGVRVPRLVLASATPVPLNIKPEPVVYTVESATFPIEFRYLDQDTPIDLKNILLEITATQALKIHRETKVETGHILIFAPGTTEVENIKNLINMSLKKHEKVIVVPAYSVLDKELINLIYKKTAPGERKIVIATNIAEMSITIEDIGHVIDTMIEKRSETSASGGFRLTTHYISKDSAKQRAGRTGRTRNGVCYRMCTKQKYESLEQHRPPEIERIPIYEVVMELLSVGLSPEKILIGVDKKRVNNAVKLLKQLGMVEGNNETDFKVTDAGQFAPKFPLSVRNAAFLWNWFNFTSNKLNNEIIKSTLEILNLDFNHMEIEDPMKTSLIDQDLLQVENILKSQEINPSSIISASSDVGFYSVNFLKLYPDAEVYAIEPNLKTARILRRNFNNLPQILRSEREYNATAINMSLEEFFSKSRYADIIFINSEADIPISTVEDVLQKGMTRSVILRLPAAINHENLENQITQGQNIKIYDIKSGESVEHILIIIENKNKILLSNEVMKKNIPDEVRLMPVNKYPLFPGIVTAAIVDCYGPSYFWMPRKTPEIENFDKFKAEHIEKYFEKYRGYSDLHTYLNMWHDLSATLKGIKITDRTLSKWSRENSMNNKKINELLTIINQCVSAAGRLGYEVQIGPFTTQGVVTAARPLFLSSYSDLILMRSGDYLSITSMDRYKLDSRDAINEIRKNIRKGVIALITAEIKTNKSLVRVVSFSLDTDIDSSGRPLALKHEQHPRKSRKLGSSSVKNALDLLSGIDLSGEDYELSSEDKALEDALVLLSQINSIDNIKPVQPKRLGGIKVSSNYSTPITENHNPPLIVENITAGNKTFNLIQDTHLEVGTKQRGLDFFKAVKDAGYTEIATYDTPHGYGQVIVSWCCKKLEMTCSLFVPKVSPRSPMTDLAIDLDAEVYEVGGDGETVKNSAIDKAVDEFCQNNETCYFIKPELDDPTYIQYLAAAIQIASQDIVPDVIWISSRSAVTVRALALAFPGVNLNIVQLENKIPLDLLENINYKIYVAPEVFDADAESPPPYDSLSGYDAKVWQFVSKHGKTGDYIWNAK